MKYRTWDEFDEAIRRGAKETDDRDRSPDDDDDSVRGEARSAPSRVAPGTEE